MLPFLPAAAAALSIGSNILGGVAAKKQAKAQAEQYRLQAQAKEREARYVQLETAQRKAAGLMNLASQMGTIQVSQASRNLSSDSGSRDALQRAFARESMLAVDAQELAGLIQRRSIMDEARGLYGSATATKRAGNMAFNLSLLKAGSMALSAFGSIGGGTTLGTGGNVSAASMSAVDVSGASLSSLSTAPAQLRF